jgi:hypothetical protein
MKSLAFLSVVLTTIVVRAGEREPISAILDTDIMGDVDDVGAVAVLHALADQGEVQILAVGVCVKNPWSPLCLDALNGYYGRPDVPLGVVKGPAHNRASKYAQAVAEEFPHVNDLENRQSWDQTAVLYAVRGLDGFRAIGGG